MWTDNFDEFRLEVYEFGEVEDRVLFLGETAGRIKGTGVPIRQPLGVVYSDFRDEELERPDPREPREATAMRHQILALQRELRAAREG